MVVLGQVHGELAHVADMFTADTVVDEALLPESISAVFLVLKDAADSRNGSLRTAADSGDTSPLQILLDHAQTLSGQEAAVDAAHYLRLLGDDLGLAALVFFVDVQSLITPFLCLSKSDCAQQLAIARPDLSIAAHELKKLHFVPLMI